MLVSRENLVKALENYRVELLFGELVELLEVAEPYTDFDVEPTSERTAANNEFFIKAYELFEAIAQCTPT